MQQVVASSGGFYANTSGSLSFTTAEMCLTDTYIHTTGILTQGFQQTFTMTTSSEVNEAIENGFDVFPNPSNGYFFVKVPGAVSEKIAITVTNLLGQRCFYQESITEPGENLLRVTMDYQAPGLYLVHITTSSTATSIVPGMTYIIQLVNY